MLHNLNILGFLFGATYPVTPGIAQGTNGTAVNPTNHNIFVDNINALGADLVAARGDGQDFPGTDHSALQATDIDDILQGIKHMIAEITGETNWFDAPSTDLSKFYTRFVELHPDYPGKVTTLSLRGAAASGTNTVTENSGEHVVSNVSRHYHENSSAEASLQDSFIAVRWTIPDDFDAWATSNAIQIEYITESGTYLNCHVDVYFYKSGTEAQLTNTTDRASTSWATLTFDDSALGSFSAGDVIEIYIKLETRNNYYARVGKIRFNYTT